MRKTISIVGLDEALWRTGLGASTKDISNNPNTRVLKDTRGNDFVDLARFDGGEQHLDVSVRVVAIGTR